jgi:hypothetical protein
MVVLKDVHTASQVTVVMFQVIVTAVHGAVDVNKTQVLLVLTVAI